MTSEKPEWETVLVSPPVTVIRVTAVIWSTLSQSHRRTEGAERSFGNGAGRQPLVGWPRKRSHRHLGNPRILHHTSPGLQAGQLHREGT